MNRYVCIHGHYYQPPRENPWLEEVEVQDSAYPYSDWNERITAECYAPNTAGRILDNERKIVDIVNNYAKTSFNIGPTLLSWMERHTNNIYQNLLDADAKSQERFSGHGSALAQGYNHMILPLANDRDLRTQVVWGIKDFEFRFKRKPEGMWLPETAVNIKTLEMLAEHGIKFTILAPHQAKRIKEIVKVEEIKAVQDEAVKTEESPKKEEKKKKEAHWIDVQGAKIDPQQPYLCNLPSGRTINLFFYDGPVSQEIAFRDLLQNGEHFAYRLMGLFPKDDKESRLVHIATDGETYGHHHRFGDMALAFCLHFIEKNKLANITIYAEYLEKFPPRFEVEIIDNSSWSCVHGVERWRSDCGCCIGGRQGWNQKWRQPLRDALDWLRDSTIPIYEKEMSVFSDNPWGVRDNYVNVILDRTVENVDKFFKENFTKELSQDDKVTILQLLEMERHAMLMYTSCGWFFDEVSGIETTQIVQYAARVIQLAKFVSDSDLEEEFVRRLKNAPSNIPEIGDASFIYDKYVKPSIINLIRVGAHYAVSSLFEGYPTSAEIYCYTAKSEFYELQEAGKQKLVIGRTRIRSNITWEEDVICFALLHLVDHILDGGVKSHIEGGSFKAMYKDIKTAFLKSDIPQVIRLMNSHFGNDHYSLWHLFKHEQKKVLDQIMDSTLREIEANFRQIYDRHYFLMQVRRDLNIALPKVLATTSEFVLNRDLRDIFEEEAIDTIRLNKVIDEILRWNFSVDQGMIRLIIVRRLNGLMQKFEKAPGDIFLLETIEALLRALKRLPIDLELWRAQNIYFQVNKQLSGKKKKQQETLDPTIQKWVQLFENLGGLLNIKVN